MTVQNPPRGSFVPFNMANVASPARPTTFGGPAYRAFQNLRNWRSGEMVGNYVGRPDPTLNGNAVSQFHLITACPPPADGTTRDIIFLIQNWYKDYKPIGGDEDIVLYDSIGGSAQTLYSNTVLEGGTDDTYTSGSPGGRYHELAGTFTPVASTTDDGFALHRLDATSCVVANLAAFLAPLGPQISDDQAITKSSDYAVGVPIRGYDTSASDPGTLGAIAHYQQNGDSVVGNTRRCLFQTPYALGTYTEATSWTAFRGSFTYRIAGRHLTGASTSLADIALCATIDVPVAGDAGIRVSSAATGDVWTYTTSSDLATPTLITTSDGTITSGSAGLEFDPDSDEILIEGYADSGGSVKLHTASAWEQLRIS